MRPKAIFITFLSEYAGWLEVEQGTRGVWKDLFVYARQCDVSFLIDVIRQID